MSDVDYTLITGAATRVGRAIALHLAAHGHHIAIHYHRSQEEARSLKNEIERMGRCALLIQGDLSQSETTASIIEAVLEVGKIRALVNNASIFERFDTRGTTLEAWQRSLAVNLTAPFLLSQAYATHSSSGRIVNLLDWRTERSDRDHLPYAVSKAALEALARNLAADLAPLFQVNGLALGAVLPPSDGRDVQAIIQDVPAKRWAAIEEVGEAVRFLLEGPSYITGEVLTLDGGRHLL
jgi:pteridine reductase